MSSSQLTLFMEELTSECQICIHDFSPPNNYSNMQILNGKRMKINKTAILVISGKICVCCDFGGCTEIRLSLNQEVSEKERHFGCRNM